MIFNTQCCNKSSSNSIYIEMYGMARAARGWSIVCAVAGSQSRGHIRVELQRQRTWCAPRPRSCTHRSLSSVSISFFLTTYSFVVVIIVGEPRTKSNIVGGVVRRRSTATHRAVVLCNHSHVSDRCAAARAGASVALRQHCRTLLSHTLALTWTARHRPSSRLSLHSTTFE